MTRRAILQILLVCSGAVIFWSSSASGALIATPPACQSQYDVFAYTPDALRACGLSVFPLTTTKALPGGGYAYTYAESSGGVTSVTDLVPPAGFNPMAATDAQLDEYGFPPRPTDLHGLEIWQSEMSRWTGAVRPEPYDVAVPSVHFDTITSRNWAGYAVSGSHGTYTHAEAWYNEPSISGSQCSNPAEGTWAGIGGEWDGYLAQNGTAHNAWPIGDHQSWWELVPGDGAHPRTLYGTPGWQFDASTRWYGSGYRFYYYDSYSGKTDAVDVGTCEYGGTSAEAIVERPGNLNNGLSNFGTWQVNQAEANGQYFYNWSPTGGRHGIWMVDSSGTVMAQPSSLDFWGDFDVYQDRCY